MREQVSETEDYWQAADLALFTSETESFCLGILEAMVFGCPSVSTAVGGIPEVVIHGETGWLVPSADAADLARATEILLHDPARRATMGKAAQQRAHEHFSAGAIVPQYEALYQKLCNSSSR